LYKYYDIQDRIQKGEIQTTESNLRAKPGSILAAFIKDLRQKNRNRLMKETGST
jgi:hypothetical protein